jgi:hypothetical protein
MIQPNSKIVSLLFILYLNVPLNKASNNVNDNEKSLRSPSDFLKKYAINSNKMTSNELGFFFKQFANSLSNYSHFNSHSVTNCINLKLTQFHNLTSDEKRKNVLIDETKLEEISSFLVANLDSCLNTNYQRKINHTDSIQSEDLTKSKSFFFKHSKEGREQYTNKNVFYIFLT